MERAAFERLHVYRLSERLADHIWSVVRRWGPFDRETTGRQLVRAADSIGANIAEGAGRATSLDNCRFIRIARGSLHETRHWLRRAVRRGMLHQVDIDIMRDLLDNLSPRLNAYLRAVQTRTPRSRQQ